MDSISVVTVTDRELGPHLEEATRKIHSFSFRAPGGAGPERPAKTTTLRGRRIAYRPLLGQDGGAAARAEETAFDLADRIRSIHPSDELYTDVEHFVLRVLRRAVQLYAYVYGSYEQASGLERLKAANRAGTLAGREEPELVEKLEAAGAVSIFAAASYVFARLEATERDATVRLSFEVDPPETLPLGSRTGALDAALHHLYRAIDAHARDDASLVKAVRDAALALAERIRSLRHSLGSLEFYTRYHYRIDPEGVRIAGFELPEARVTSDIVVPEKRPEDVVGNHRAKLEAIRVAQRLACYDPERQDNPFVDLGGFVFTFIGDGKPGTGKTTLIQMIVTLLRDYTAVARVPLRYENFSVDQISDYQGRSGQNAARFTRSLLDPRVVGFGTVDDVDQVCGSRNDRNASAGQLEVTAVFMQEFAGANTVVRGNATFGLFSNHPEKVDDALRQRMQSRFLVDGPQTREDFTDLLYILLHRHWEIPPGADYDPLGAQEVLRRVRLGYAEHDVPRSAGLRRVFDRVVGDRGTLSTWREFGEYLHALQQHDERFTGRAIKNVADAVQARMMDFDLPSEWFEKRDLFFGRPWETRVAMISELRGAITPEMVIQEIHRYAESETRYSEVSDARELEERTRHYVLEARARKAAAAEEA